MEWLAANSCNFKIDNGVHIWRIPLVLPQARITQFRNYLSADEIKRAEKFHFERDRTSYISAHGYLRTLLEHYLNFPAEQFQFDFNEYGKPFLKNETIQFNISHSKQLGLIAFDANFEIGVDIEFIRPNYGGLKIAKRFFSAEEVKELEGLETDQRLQGFFNCWTRKEAYIKAQGKGLALPLNQFSVNLTPGEPAELLSTNHDPEARYNYTLLDIKVDEQYAAALVCRKARTTIKLFDLTADQVPFLR